ncbi:MAG: Na+/H+ antiporter NhaC family protein [Muribaculaceae bacterium]|nr:Na+/H+ antiporter NhaC family protein [Muribaculaceae bacterium]
MSGIKVDISSSKGIIAVSPIIVFLLVYLLTSLVCGDFYRMPISVALLIASMWAACIMRGKTLAERIEIFSKEAGSSNVLYMVWIFILAGAFAAIAKKTGAVEATVDITLSFLPASMIVPGLFIATCFISMSIGTSVGTVVALTPFASQMAEEAGAPIPFFVAIVLGGAFFGDNLSFISDTTIAATRTQGCNMKDKFKANLAIVLPAAIIALGLYCFFAPSLDINPMLSGKSHALIIPYLVVIACALLGINVTLVLLLGIASAIIVGLANGLVLLDIFSMAGEGIDSVGALIIVTLLAAGMLGMIKSAGGIDFILKVLGKNINTSRGAQLSISLLVGIVNLCTANNTVAIITVGSLAKRISSHYGIPPRKSASLLDTGSCITQALIPYGAQSLMAASLAGISPVAPWRYLFYPQILILCLGISILITKKNPSR